MRTAHALATSADRWPYHPDLLAKPVPRYTSYPTAAEFTDGANAGSLEEALDQIDSDAPVSLYLHIPYCHEICWYCGCNTGAANRSARLDRYLETLHQEIALVGARLGRRGRVQRIAFGGGSPNAIAPAQFDALVDALARNFQLDEPALSVELDPRGFQSDWAEALRRNGVRRASLGVQTLEPNIQSAIGRIQPAETIRLVMRQLSDAGLDSVNFDLMYGLPGQSARDLLSTLECAVAMGPQRLAVFGYAHVPHLIPRQRRIDATCLPDAAERFAQAELAHQWLTQSGYVAVGFDHFAQPDDALAQATAASTLRRNFQGFTEDQAEVLIGLGASAISAFPDRLLQNEKNAGRYGELVRSGSFPVTRGVARDAEDRARGRIIEQILTSGRAVLPPGLDLAPELDAIAPFASRGLVRLAGAAVTLLPGALPYARTIAAVFDRHRPASVARFSSAV